MLAVALLGMDSAESPVKHIHPVALKGFPPDAAAAETNP